MSRRFDAMASAKVFSGKPEQTAQNLKLIRYPVLCSLKYDGWRMFEFNGEVRNRSLKPPKNLHVQKIMREMFAAASILGVKGLDGESVAGDPWHPNCMQNCTSAFATIQGEPEFTFNVFDSYQYADRPFSERLKYATEAVKQIRYAGDGHFNWVQSVEHKLVHNEEELLAYLAEIEAKGGEGVMGRDPNGPYKFGRSTMREGWLWALKPYADDEAEIIGFDEMLENQNELTTNERGYASRAGHKEFFVPKGTLGRFRCRSSNFTEEFHVGMGIGLTFALRDAIWANREKYLGKIIKFKYQEVGCVDRPRQPKFMGFRDPTDIAL